MSVPGRPESELRSAPDEATPARHWLQRCRDVVVLRQWRGATARADWTAAWTSAFIMLPQAVLLATLAGLPPETGLYASVFPVIVAALTGRCPLLLSGPNTAVSVMIAAALVPLATPFSADYVKLALVLSLLVGLVQLAAAVLRTGRLFELLPMFMVRGVTLGVGIVIVSTQTSALLGVLGVHCEAPWLSLWRLPESIERANPAAVAVAAVTCAVGLAMRGRRLARWCPPLVAALCVGTLFGLLLDFLFGAAPVRLDRVGFIALVPLPLSLPAFHWEELYLIKQLVINAVAIAFVGTLQTLIIVKGNETSRGGSHAPAPDREMFAQGMANVASAFTSSFAGSGSFNRSAAHAAAGAKTRMAAVLSSLIMFALGFGAAGLMALVPLPALAATLVLVGVDLIRSVLKQAREAADRIDRVSMFLLAGMTLATGLESALVGGLVLSAGVALWRRAQAQAAASPAAATDLQPAPQLLAPIEHSLAAAPLPADDTAQRPAVSVPSSRTPASKPALVALVPEVAHERRVA